MDTVEIKDKADAQRVINEILAQNKALQGALAQSDAAVNDLRAAVRAMGEQRVLPAEATGEERQLGQYVVGQVNETGIKRGVRLVQDSEPQGLEAKHRDYGLLDDPAPVCQWQAKLQTLVEQRSWVRLAGMNRTNRSDLAASPKTDARILAHLKVAPPMIQRIFADISNVGAELVPDILLPDLERALILGAERRVVSLFPSIDMPAKNWLAPYASGGLRPYKKGEPASASDDNPGQYTVSSPTLAQRTITAVAMAVRCVVDDDASEDSVLAGIQIMQEMVLDALLDGQEDAVINSDTAATHQDTGINSWNVRSRWGTASAGTSDHRATILGLRASAIDVASSAGIRDGGSAQTLAGMMTSRADMGLHAFPAPGNLVCLLSPEYLLKASLFSEFISVDKAGEMAFNVNGLIGRVGDIPLVVSPYIDRQYNASGIFDNTTKTKTGFLLVNRARWKVYRRKGAMVEAGRDVTRGITHVVGTMRWQFKTLDSNAAENTNVHWTYNLTP